MSKQLPDICHEIQCPYAGHKTDLRSSDGLGETCTVICDKNRPDECPDSMDGGE
jgi:hypothetical protein